MKDSCFKLYNILNTYTKALFFSKHWWLLEKTISSHAFSTLLRHIKIRIGILEADRYRLEYKDHGIRQMQIRLYRQYSDSVAMHHKMYVVFVSVHSDLKPSICFSRVNNGEFQSQAGCRAYFKTRGITNQWLLEYYNLFLKIVFTAFRGICKSIILALGEYKMHG